MKRNIVICCDMMDAARLDNAVFETTEGQVFARLDSSKRGAYDTSNPTSEIQFCPWCGTKLPFPFEEEEKLVLSNESQIHISFDPDKMA